MGFYGVLFTVLLALLLLRAFVLKGRAQSLNSEEFRRLPKGAALAVLKDRLLNAPTRANLGNLAEFCGNVGLPVDKAAYEPLMREQNTISKFPDALARDSALFEREAEWLDTLTPPELTEAEAALARGEKQKFKAEALTAALRFYSDAKIEETLALVAGEFPEASALLAGYRELELARDSSPADEASLRALRARRDAWERSVEEAIGG